MRASTLIVVIAIALISLYLIWQMVNSSLAGRARGAPKKRKSDRLRLSRSERKSYKYAQKLYKEGNFRACAKILETLGMLRESINILEKGGLIREASDTLMRIQRPNRAGHMLARHGMWKEAIECYKKANMPLEVGKCARELGDIVTAIPYFIEAGATLEAAECFAEVGKRHEAARSFLKAKDFDRAVEQYVHLVDSHPDIEKIDFSEDELLFITKKLVEGKVDTRLADILVSKHRSTQLMIELIKNNNVRAATAAYMRNTIDIGPELIAYKDFTSEETIRLGELFSNVGAYEYGGMVLERLEEFELAGEAFEKGEFYERASYCFERANNAKRTTEMRIMIASRGSKPSKPLPPKSEEPAKKSKQENPNPFSISDTATDHISQPARALDPIPEVIPKPTDAYLRRGMNGLPEPPKMMLDPDINWESFFQAEFMMDLTTPEQELMQGICRTKEYEKGSVILDFNQEPLGIYFVLDGTVVVSKRDSKGEDREVDQLDPSSTFGELWLLMDQATKVKFSAKTDTLMGWIKRADFESLMDKNGSIARKLYRRYAFKLVSKLVSDQNQRPKKAAS